VIAMSEMAVVRIPYVNTYRDRHGTVRHYFRKRGHKPVALPGIPGSVEFMAAYQEALGGLAPKGPRQGPGSVGALIFDYLRSSAFTNLKPASQRAYRVVLVARFNQFERT
jgi:hypothetical protein